MNPSNRRGNREKLRGGLSIALVALVYVAVLAVAVVSPAWLGSLAFSFIVIASLGLVFAGLYLNGRRKLS